MNQSGGPPKQGCNVVAVFLLASVTRVIAKSVSSSPMLHPEPSNPRLGFLAPFGSPSCNLLAVDVTLQPARSLPSNLSKC